MGHKKTNVDCWVDTLEEELSLQEDLAISDGDNLSPDFIKCQKQLYMKMYVGWDVRHISTLSLNDRKCGE